LIAYPENLLSFSLTIFGMMGLTIFVALSGKKALGAENKTKQDIKTIGAIITILGLFYLWNYLSWVFFGKDETWSYWYLWFLGNPNLWLLSIPMVGLPLLFEQKLTKVAVTD
jgi:hypothetical protein